MGSVLALCKEEATVIDSVEEAYCCDPLTADALEGVTSPSMYEELSPQVIADVLAPI